MHNEDKIRDVMELIISLHKAADYYEKSGFNPYDFIKSMDEASDDCDMRIENHFSTCVRETITWGEACRFVILHSEEYKQVLRLFLDKESIKHMTKH